MSGFCAGMKTTCRQVASPRGIRFQGKQAKLRLLHITIFIIIVIINLITISSRITIIASVTIIQLYRYCHYYY